MGPAQAMATQIIRTNKRIRNAQKLQDRANSEEDRGFQILQDMIRRARQEQHGIYAVVRLAGMESEVGEILRKNNEEAF